MYHKLQILTLKALDREGIRHYASQAGLTVPVDENWYSSSGKSQKEICSCCGNALWP